MVGARWVKESKQNCCTDIDCPICMLIDYKYLKEIYKIQIKTKSN